MEEKTLDQVNFQMYFRAVSLELRTDEAILASIDVHRPIRELRCAFGAVDVTARYERCTGNVYLPMTESPRHDFWVGLGILAMDCVLLEMVLPLSPVIIDGVYKSLAPKLPPFTLYQRSMADAALMLPLLLFVRTKGGTSKFFGLVMIAGAILYAGIILIDIPTPPVAFEGALPNFYNFIMRVLALTMCIRFCTEVHRCLIVRKLSTIA
jgi:hypothetical protein